MSAAANLLQCKRFDFNKTPGHLQFVRFNSKTYYDTLELGQNCSQEQIRESFVRLSKLHHPDSNVSQKGTSGSKTQTKRFQDIMEAYKILGKSDSRQAYDRSLQFNFPYEKVIKVEYDAQVFRPNKMGFTDPHSYPPPNTPYYGFHSIKGRLSNKVIVIACLIFTGIGFATQMAAIRHSFVFRGKQIEEKSALISKAHKEVRAEAEKLGNDAQIERLKKRLQVVDSE